MQQGDGKAGREQQMAGETNYDAGDGQPLLRKKYHVVRKLFYVASISGGAAGRKNRPPWEKFEAVS